MIKKPIYIGIAIGLGAIAMSAIIYRISSNKKIDTSIFDSPDKPGSGECMDKVFIKRYAEMIKYIKKHYPYKYALIMSLWNVNSGVRSLTHNKKVGGVSNSAHITCYAADLKAPFQWMRDIIVEAAVKVGFTRIGIGKTFVHLDSDPSKKQYATWGYPVGKTAPPYNPFIKFQNVA